MFKASKFTLTSGKSAKDTCRYWFVNNGGQGYDLGFPSVAFFLALAHVLSPAIVYEIVTNQPWYTLMWGTLLALFTNCSVVCGSHLLWAHRAYKAKWPLRVFFMIGHTMRGQWTIFKWASQHRGHHKWSDTDGDPHNPSRGFFYAHIGWIMLKKDPEAVAMAAILDYRDLLRDPIVRFQKQGWGAAITFGGGYHNFHHMFPSDHTCSEPDRKFNMGRPLINFMAELGQAYDSKSPSPTMVQKLKEKAAQEKTPCLTSCLIVTT
ncbi:Stearoyl-CoA desaturase 5 [Halotydeus destructor]|nr:Stearoyl-CoA desaturase 5 [Halotydeus destructor]